MSRMGSQKPAGGHGDSSRMSSKRGPSGWSSTKARPSGAVARELDLTESAFRAWVEQARADRTKGKTGADDRRARGAGAAAQGESAAAAWSARSS